MLSEEAAKAIIDWESINPRTIGARFYGGTISMSATQGYAPTNDSEPDLKEEL